jgi:hypothetical protein
LFEKYARSEELHQRKVKSQRKPKDPPQSSRTWTRPSQSDSSRDSRSQQQVHNIANQHPAGETPRCQDYPPRATAMARVVGAEDGRNSRADFTSCFTAKTARTQRGIAQNEGHQGQDVPGTTRRQPKSCRTHISTPPPTTIQPQPRPASTQPRIPTPLGGTSRTTPTSASAPASAKHPPPKSPPSTKTGRLR